MTAEIRRLLEKFKAYRDAPMTKGSKVEVDTIRKTLNVVVIELEAVLAASPLEDMRHLLQRLRGWDMMDYNKTDGDYWRAEIDRVLAASQMERPYVDIARTPFEAFGHNEACGKWVEGETSISLDHHRPCTCGGVELHPDGEASPALEEPVEYVEMPDGKLWAVRKSPEQEDTKP